MSITRKLIILFFIVGMSCLIVVGVYSFYNAKKAILSRTLDQLTSIRVIKKRQIGTFFEERYKNLGFLSQTDYMKNIFDLLKEESVKMRIDNNPANAYFSSVKEKIDYKVYGFSNMYLVCSGPQNDVCFFQVHDSVIRPFSGDTVTKRLLEQLASSVNNDKPSIIDFTKRSAEDNNPVCLMGMKVRGSSSFDFGVLCLQIPITAVNSLMLEDSRENGLGESGEIYLVGADYLMRSNSRFIPYSVLKIPVQTASAKNAFMNKIGSAIIDDYRTVPCLSSYDRISVPGLNWIIIAEIDCQEAMIPIVSLRNDILFLSFLICIFLFSIAHIISRSISQPVIKLKNAARSIGEGKFDISLKPVSKDEIGMLTETFNTMSLQLKEERLKRMSALYDGQELERQRISRELHDGLGQKLVAVKLMLESTSKQNDEDARKMIDEVKTDFLTIIDELRQISNDLAPHILSESGLDVALRNLCSSVASTFVSGIDFSAYGDFHTEDTKMKMYIYRIAQEGLNNVVKHSAADHADVQLMGNTEYIFLVIEDNGRGFSIDDKSVIAGNGIYNMRERARLLNGSLDIESEPGKGTTLRLKIPKGEERG